jgi:cytochrome c biogenesis protein CcdA
MIGIATANRTIFPASPWTAAGIGLLLILMGMMMLLRHNLSLTGPIERLAGRFQRKNSSNRGLAFYYFYGLSYAIASCGCAMPLFASMILFAFSESLTNGIMVFGAYAWGMTTMMLLLSILTVFARAVLQQYLKSLVPFIQIVSGVVMVGAGSYLLYEQLKLIAP